MSGSRSSVQWLAAVGLSGLALVVGMATGALVVWLLASGSGAAPGGPPAGAAGGLPPAQVRAGVAERREMEDRFEVVGQLEEVRRATAAAEVQGRVLSVPIEAGDRVKGGETVLAQIDDVWARLELERTVAEVAAADAVLKQAKRDLKYLEALRETGSAKPREVDDARSTVDEEQANYDAAIAARDRAQESVQRLRVVAPFDGVVVQKLTEAGQWVQSGTPIAELISAGEVDAVVDVPEALVNEVRPGEEVEVHIDPLDETYSGKVISVTPFGDRAARTYPVEVRLADEGGRLKPGMSVTARIPVARRSLQLTVPRDAVRFGAQGPVVWTVLPLEAEGAMPSVMPVPVNVVFAVADRYVVAPSNDEGAQWLRDKALVVTEGAERLAPGQPLMIQNQPPTMAEPNGKNPADPDSLG